VRPRLLDLFCCAGGAGVGYHRAGFDVVGVDNKPQPRFPFEFKQADVLGLSVEFLRSFDAIHASPPCQAFSRAQRLQRRAHPALVEPVREMLRKSAGRRVSSKERSMIRLLPTSGDLASLKARAASGNAGAVSARKALVTAMSALLRVAVDRSSQGTRCGPGPLQPRPSAAPLSGGGVR
jgi:hypothetical protein